MESTTIETVLEIAVIATPILSVVTIVALAVQLRKAKKDAKQYWDWMCNKKQEVDEWVSKAQSLDRDLGEAKQELKDDVKLYDDLDAAYEKLHQSKVAIVAEKKIMATELGEKQKSFDKLMLEKKALERKLETTEYNLVEANDSRRIAKDNWSDCLNELTGLEKAYNELNAQYKEMVKANTELINKNTTLEDQLLKKSEEVDQHLQDLRNKELELDESKDAYNTLKWDKNALGKLVDELKAENIELAEELVELEDSDVDKILILWEAYEDMPLEEKKAKILEVLLSEYKEN